MKALLFLFSAAFATSLTESQTLFESWMVKFGRNYSTQEEYNNRLENFRANLDTIELLNLRHKNVPNGARFGVNKYADLSRQEQRRLRGFRGADLDPSALPPRVSTGAGAKPTAPFVDWRTRNVVAPIQNQGMCGSCWAFSTTSNIESTIAIATNASTTTKLSEQQIIDCDHLCGTYRGERGCDDGCLGGLPPNAYTWVIKNGGLTTEEALGYEGVSESCPTKSLPTGGKIDSYVLVSEDEVEMADWTFNKGPLSVAVDASEWTFYFGGVMEYLCWGTYSYSDLDHAVNIVGYGTQSDGKDFWIIRNSWGADWGEDGYAKILRGDKFCGVNLFATSAVVKA